MDANVLYQVFVPIIFQSVATLVGIFFIFQRTQEKIKSDIEYLKKEMESQNETIRTILELKLNVISEAHENLNVRVSKLEQFRDDMYSHGLFNSLLPPSPRDNG